MVCYLQTLNTFTSTVQVFCTNVNFIQVSLIMFRKISILVMGMLSRSNIWCFDDTEPKIEGDAPCTVSCWFDDGCDKRKERSQSELPCMVILHCNEPWVSNTKISSPRWFFLNPATMPTTLHHIHAISSISIT